MNDKILHFLASFIIAIIISFVFYGGRNNISVFVFTFSVGLIKEILDISNGGSLEESALDLLADIAGIIAAGLFLG